MRYRLLHLVVLGCGLALGAGSAWAVDCRMPNGKVVSFSSMAACPADAAQLDAQGKVVRPPTATAKPAAPAARATPAPAPKPVETHVVRPREVTVVDAGYALCNLLKQRGAASQCKVEVNFLSASTIEITTMDNPRMAFSTCVEVAKQLRLLAPNYARQGNWEIRLYSPFSGDRPTGTCPL